jgi:PTS system mannose-specific IIA component
MIGVIIASHGRLSEELLASAETIVGKLAQVRTVCISCKDAETPSEAIGRRVDELDQGQGVLVLVDLFGGSPSQAACALLHDKRVEVISGVNLPMLVKLATLRTDDGPGLEELSRILTAYGQKNVVLASELVRSYTAASGAAAAGSGATASKGS